MCYVSSGIPLILGVKVVHIYLYHGAWADQRLATVLQISCCPVYKWFVTQL